MESESFRESKTRMVCRECIDRKAKNQRRYRTWDSLRAHLIGHHGYDSREVPE